MNIPLEGTIRLHKSIIDHPIWRNAEYLRAWIFLLLIARNKDGQMIDRGEIIMLKRGHVYRSIEQLRRLLGSEGGQFPKSWQWVKNFLNFCEDYLMIKVQSSRRGTVITIINYDTPTEESRGLMVWDTETGKVVFQYAVIQETEMFAANIFIGDRVNRHSGNS
jgi:hypothetical protein